MADNGKSNQPMNRFLPGNGTGGYGPAEIVAGVIALVWVTAAGIYFWTAPGGEDTAGPGLVLTLLVLLLPLVLLGAAVATYRSVRQLRAEAAELQSTVDAMRNAYLASQQSAAAGMGTAAPAPLGADPARAADPRPSDSRPAEPRPVDPQPAAPQPRTVAPRTAAPAPAASFASRRDASLSEPSADRRATLAPARAHPGEDQPGLALGTPPESATAPLEPGDFIRALEFPESPEDREGFRALRLALADRSVAKLIRAAQDALTLLAQDGIFMDDLSPDRARPELWRRFAAGERGRTMAALGGIHDRSSLALTAGRMREDPVFRDAAHHFLRAFDRSFAEFEKVASDAEISALADTRTARAFMLFGRVAGIFD